MNTNTDGSYDKNTQRFSKKTKLTAAAFQGVSLKGNHADHIVPKSKNGSADITNIQITTASANITKSNNLFEPRKWQKDFKQVWDRMDQDKPFLCTVIPGGGKTMAALWVSHKWLRERPGRKLIIVVPSDNLKTQWQEEAARWFGIELKTQDVDIPTNEIYDGFCVTYQSLRSSELWFRRFCYNNESILILDEPHHCSEDKIWGERVETAFEYAKRKLLLSGTPFRTDGTKIPYVQYDARGFCKSDYRYDYPEALRDRIVRYIKFLFEKGEYRKSVFGEIEKYKIDLDEEDNDTQNKLRDLFNPKGAYVKKVIQKAHEKLLEIRKHTPDAAAMAVCVNHDYALKTAKLIKDITGVMPSIIVSDTEINNDSVGEFRKNNNAWLVSIRKVSEGTDIKRLQVLCYLTNATTRLFFRQLIGRIMRVRYENNDIDNECYCFLPAYNRLKENAENIEESQQLAIDLEIEEYETGRREYSERQLDLSEFIDSDHTGTQLVLINGKQYTTEQEEVIQGLANAMSTTNEKAAIAYDYMNRHVDATPIQSTPMLHQKPKHIQIKEKSAQIHKLVGYIKNTFESAGVKLDYNYIHLKANKAIGELSQKNMSLKQLEKKEEFLHYELTNAKRAYNERKRK